MSTKYYHDKTTTKTFYLTFEGLLNPIFFCDTSVATC